MADLKISQLPAVNTVSSTDLLAIVQGGATSKITSLQSGLYGVTSPTYLLTAFQTSDTNHIYLLSSSDYTNFNLIGTTYLNFTSSTGTARDTSVIQRNNVFLFAFTSTNSTSTSFGIAQSTDLMHGTQVSNVDVSGTISGVTNVWAPEWFVDPANSSLHILFAASTDSEVTSKLYEIHPTNPTALPTAWTWSAPVQITGTGFQSSIIDPFIFPTPKTGGGYVYNLVYSDQVGPPSHRICLATSTSPFSGYTAQGGTDFFNNGGLAEGPFVISLPGINLCALYFDNIGGNTGYTTMNYSSTTGLLGFTNQGSYVTLTNNFGSSGLRHGTMIALSGNYSQGSGLFSDRSLPAIAPFLVNCAQTNFANTFTANQSITGTLAVSSSINSVGGVSLGGAVFNPSYALDIRNTATLQGATANFQDTTSNQCFYWLRSNGFNLQVALGGTGGSLPGHYYLYNGSFTTFDVDNSGNAVVPGSLTGNTVVSTTTVTATTSLLGASGKITGGLSLGAGTAPSSGLFIGGLSGNTQNVFVEIAKDSTGLFAGDNGIGQFMLRGTTDSNMRVGLMIDTTLSIGKLQALERGTGALTMAIQSAGGRTLISTATDDGSNILQVNGNTKITGVTTSTGNIIILSAGSGLQIKEGSNARMGTATLVAGTVTIANTSITSNTRIFLSRSSLNSSPALGLLTYTISAGTSFTVNSESVISGLVATDVSQFNWVLVESA